MKEDMSHASSNAPWVTIGSVVNGVRSINIENRLLGYYSADKDKGASKMATLTEIIQDAYQRGREDFKAPVLDSFQEFMDKSTEEYFAEEHSKIGKEN